MPFDPYGWIAEELEHWTARGLRRQPAVRDSAQQVTIQLAEQSLLNFASNDYLGLANDPRLCQAAITAIESAGFGAGASPLVAGRGRWHQRLETELAAFEKVQAALLFPTGFAANVGSVTALAGPGDAIFSDAKNHASIIDGCRLSGAAVHVFPHGDVDTLRELLRCDRSRRRLMVTDGLFSMDGDLAPLPALCQLAEEQQAMLLVDEAHATGVLGANGRGACEALNVESASIIRIGTLSKALGSAGGFVVGSEMVIDWLRNRGRPYMFSTALPEATAAAAVTSLQIVQTEPERRERLLALAANLREELRRAGWNVGKSASQIVPIMVGDPDATMMLAVRLRSAGMFVPGIRPPSVPSGESLLRISLTSEHTRAHCAALLAALGSAPTGSRPG